MVVGRIRSQEFCKYVVMSVPGPDPGPGPDPDPDGQNCSARTRGNTAWRAYVESYSSNPKSVVLRFVDNPGCDAFYRCGDVRFGGLPGWNNEKERWVGVMCDLKFLAAEGHISDYRSMPAAMYRDLAIRSIHGPNGIAITIVSAAATSSFMS